jgi:hypothetical protein
VDAQFAVVVDVAGVQTVATDGLLEYQAVV